MSSGWTTGGLCMTEPAPTNGPERPVPYLDNATITEMSRRLYEACYAHRNENRKLAMLHMLELSKMLYRYGVVS